MDVLVLFKTVILALVAGLTEFLPISSTGHLMRSQNDMLMFALGFVVSGTAVTGMVDWSVGG